jgi:hypothetical protein
MTLLLNVRVEMKEDDPVTQDTITARSSSEDNDDDNSGQSSGNNGNDDNDAERATSDVKATNEPNCTKVQEPGLFTTCIPSIKKLEAFWMG